MQPGKDSEGANFYRTRRHDLDLPQGVDVLGGNIHGPRGTPRSHQAGHALFPANAQGMAVLLSGLDGSVNDGLRRRDISYDVLINVALASLVPIEGTAFV